MKFLFLTLFLAMTQAAFGQAFVKAKGQQFTLNDKPFYFQGSNSYDAGLLTGTNDQEIYQRFEKYSAAGLKVVRIWGFSCSGQASNPMILGYQNGRVIYNENAMRRFDLAVDAARRSNVKIIFPFVNFEPDLCGMDFWVKEVTGQSDRHLFYTDSRVQAAFRAHVTTLLNRVNTRTKERTGLTVQYKNDSTIFAIEMANEPHTSDNYEKDRGMVPGTLVFNWLTSISNFVRSIDKNHLLSTGEEGYKTSHSGITSRHQWIHNGLKGSDFARNVTIPNINLVTVHIYPDNWAVPSSDFGFVEKELIADRARIAHAAGKPIILEETGFSRGPAFEGKGYNRDPQTWLAKIYAAANANNFAGTLVWQVVPNGGTGGYNFNFDDVQFNVIKNQVRFMNNKGGSTSTPSGPQCSDIPPDSNFTCVQQASFGKCGQVWMQNRCNKSCGRCS